jgi:hypothetical protein
MYRPAHVQVHAWHSNNATPAGPVTDQNNTPLVSAVHGATAPSGQRPPHNPGFMTALRYTTLGRTSSGTVIGPSNTQHAPGRNRTHNRSKRRHWDRTLECSSLSFPRQFYLCSHFIGVSKQAVCYSAPQEFT